MTVYVDNMYLFLMGQFRGMKMSHLIADTEAELHAMADKIGVARKWYQGDHYDIAQSKRELAIKHGAVAIELKQLAAMMFIRRCTPNGVNKKLTAPDKAQAKMIRMMEKGRAA